MKSFSDLFKSGKMAAKPGKEIFIDEKTVLFLAEKVIGDLYGLMGQKQVRPRLYRSGTLYFSVGSSSWANELWVSREKIRLEVNRRSGSDCVRAIKVSEES